MSDRPATEMELRVAKAINDAEQAWLCQAGDALEGLREEVTVPLPIAVARAAIQAMREPTAEMGLSKVGIHAWQAMINTASPPGDKEHG